ncbi:unnamed protein product [Lampetra fluviatilis]
MTHGTERADDVMTQGLLSRAARDGDVTTQRYVTSQRTGRRLHDARDGDVTTQREMTSRRKGKTTSPRIVRASSAKRFPAQRAVLGNSAVALLTGSFEQIYQSATFKCPCSPGVSQIYAATSLLVPALVLLAMGYSANARTWKLVTGCCSFRPLRGFGGLRRFLRILLSVTGRALVAPGAWLLVALFDGSYFVCGASPYAAQVQSGFLGGWLPTVVDGLSHLPEPLAKMNHSQLAPVLAALPCRRPEGISASSSDQILRQLAIQSQHARSLALRLEYRVRGEAAHASLQSVTQRSSRQAERNELGGREGGKEGGGGGREEAFRYRTQLRGKPRFTVSAVAASLPRKHNQLWGWFLLATAVVLAMSCSCLAHCTAPVSYLHLQYWRGYIEAEGELFQKRASEHSRELASKNVDRFFQRDVGGSPLASSPSIDDWSSVSRLYVFHERQPLRYSTLDSWAQSGAPQSGAPQKGTPQKGGAASPDGEIEPSLAFVDGTRLLRLRDALSVDSETEPLNGDAKNRLT